MFSKCKPEDERRKRVRKTDIAQKLLNIITSAGSTVFLGLILWGVTGIMDNQQTLIINDEVAKEHLINFEKSTKKTHDRQELKLESVDHKVNNLDKRVTVLERYPN